MVQPLSSSLSSTSQNTLPPHASFNSSSTLLTCPPQGLCTCRCLHRKCSNALPPLPPPHFACVTSHSSDLLYCHFLKGAATLTPRVDPLACYKLSQWDVPHLHGTPVYVWLSIYWCNYLINSYLPISQWVEAVSNPAYLCTLSLVWESYLLQILKMFNNKSSISILV